MGPVGLLEGDSPIGQVVGCASRTKRIKGIIVEILIASEEVVSDRFIGLDEDWRNSPAIRTIFF